MSLERKDFEMFDGSRRLICVVDDERTTALLLSMMLESEFDVCVAHTGTDAIEMIGKHRPDLVLLDIVLPDLNGYEVCGELRKKSATRDIPVIFLSGLVENEYKHTDPDATAVDYLTKPVNSSLLKARIAKVLRMHDLNSELCNTKSQAGDAFSRKIA